MIPRFFLVALLCLAALTSPGDEGFVALFNGKDLTDWDGDPALWKVEKGIITGTCTGPGTPPHNDFLIWRGGELKDFELRVTARVLGDEQLGNPIPQPLSSRTWDPGPLLAIRATFIPRSSTPG